PRRDAAGGDEAAERGQHARRADARGGCRPEPAQSTRGRIVKPGPAEMLGADAQPPKVTLPRSATSATSPMPTVASMPNMPNETPAPRFTPTSVCRSDGMALLSSYLNE